MERSIKRIRFREPEGEKLTLDIWCIEGEDKVIRAEETLSFYGEWIDSSGNLFPLIIRYDGSVEYGIWGDPEYRGSTFSVHGRALSGSTRFAYRSKGYDCNFVIDAVYDGEGWTRF